MTTLQVHLSVQRRFWVLPYLRVATFLARFPLLRPALRRVTPVIALAGMKTKFTRIQKYVGR